MARQSEGQGALMDQQSATYSALASSQGDMARTVDAFVQRTAAQGAIVSQDQSQ